MEPNPFFRILEWFFEGDDAPAKLFLVGCSLVIFAQLVRIFLR